MSIWNARPVSGPGPVVHAAGPSPSVASRDGASAGDGLRRAMLLGGLGAAAGAALTLTGLPVVGIASAPMGAAVGGAIGIAVALAVGIFVAASRRDALAGAGALGPAAAGTSSLTSPPPAPPVPSW